jgi:hypothetical protein
MYLVAAVRVADVFRVRHELGVPPTLEARTADRVIACLRKAIEELAAARPRNALAMVANAQDGASTLRGMIERRARVGRAGGTQIAAAH